MAQHRQVLAEGYRLLRANPGAPVLLCGAVIVTLAVHPLQARHAAQAARLVGVGLSTVVIWLYLLRVGTFRGLGAQLAQARSVLASGAVPAAYDSALGRRVLLPAIRVLLRVRPEPRGPDGAAPRDPGTS
jgi:hypothetical protein